MNRRVLLPLFLTALMTVPALAQDANSGAEQGSSNSNRGDRGDRGNRDRGNRGDFRERMNNFIKERLGSPSDDEWKVIEPKLQKVAEARRDVASFGRGMFGGRGGDRDRNADNKDDNKEQRSAVQKASNDLQKTLDNKDASPEEITKKLTALREAKEKAKATLTAAQKDLKDVLTQRQEAALVMLGILD
jgi:hypothetical protein